MAESNNTAALLGFFFLVFLAWVVLTYCSASLHCGMRKESYSPAPYRKAPWNMNSVRGMIAQGVHYDYDPNELSMRYTEYTD